MDENLPSAKRLRSVIHSIAHHSVSGLCRLHPHLGEACKSTGLDRIALDLLDGDATSDIERKSSNVGGAADALREKFGDVLKSESISPDDLTEATALFLFQKGRWPSACHVRVVDTAGRVFEIAVDAMGNPAEIVTISE